MLPVAFSGEARLIYESGDHGGRPKIEKTYVAVLQHKQRIRGDPRKPVGSNKSNVFVIKFVFEKSIGEIAFLAKPVATGCSWGSPSLGVVR